MRTRADHAERHDVVLLSPRGGDPVSADAIVERFNTLAEWFTAIKTHAAESETSCARVGLERLRRGIPFDPAHTSEALDESDAGKLWKRDRIPVIMLQVSSIGTLDSMPLGRVLVPHEDKLCRHCNWEPVSGFL